MRAQGSSNPPAPASQSAPLPVLSQQTIKLIVRWLPDGLTQQAFASALAPQFPNVSIPLFTPASRISGRWRPGRAVVSFSGSNAKVAEFSKFVETSDFTAVGSVANDSSPPPGISNIKKELGLSKLYKPHVEVALCQQSPEIRHIGAKLKLQNTYATDADFMEFKQLYDEDAPNALLKARAALRIQPDPQEEKKEELPPIVAFLVEKKLAEESSLAERGSKKPKEKPPKSGKPKKGKKEKVTKAGPRKDVNGAPKAAPKPDPPVTTATPVENKQVAAAPVKIMKRESAPAPQAPKPSAAPTKKVAPASAAPVVSSNEPSSQPASKSQAGNSSSRGGRPKQSGRKYRPKNDHTAPSSNKG
eukprot:TRINITY_DN156_c0_g1_i1.p1 TRINITY_DN156_c0_g1~~TRINITY_DN156_c0_g1_i1.p1  ORF type:complete len:359 (-),score=112.19 TRINITY_DN156_c0_g1_i1:182-1258(-)